VRVSYPALIPGEASNTAESGLALAGPAAAENMGFQPAPGDFRTIEPAAEPLPSQHRSVAFVRADLQAVVRGEMALAAPLNTRAPNRKSDLWAAVPAPLASEPLPYKSRDPALAPSCLSPTGEALSDLLNALITSAEDRERAAILAIHASFSQEPGVILLPAPREIVMAPAPPAEQWMRSGKLKFTAAAPLVAEPRVPAEPRHPTLAGPSLPPQLLNLDLQNSTLGPRRKRVSSWMITLIAATVLVVGVASVLQFGNANRDTASASTAGPPSMPAPAQPARAAAAPIHVVQEHPAARSVEVAGVRVVPGPNKKTQLEYLVINHSALDLAGLNIRIAVRSVDALAGPPLFSVSNIIATLAANQSKEIRTDLDSTIQPAALPDWQSLRTEVLIARQ
jgi:hypothetical protein